MLGLALPLDVLPSAGSMVRYSIQVQYHAVAGPPAHFTLSSLTVLVSNDTTGNDSETIEPPSAATAPSFKMQAPYLELPLSMQPEWYCDSDTVELLVPLRSELRKPVKRRLTLSGALTCAAKQTIKGSVNVTLFLPRGALYAGDRVPFAISECN